VLAGCGGAGQGIGAPPALAQGVAPASTLDSALFGTWKIIHSTKDGVDIWCGTPQLWVAKTVRDVLVLSSNGTYTHTFYNDAGTVTWKNAAGSTWSTSGGYVTYEGATASHKYSVSGNVYTDSYGYAGHTWVNQWAKVTPLTGHVAALEKTWKASSVWVDGTLEAPSVLTGSTIYPGFAQTFSTNGSSQYYDLKGTVPLLPLAAPQTWHAGQGVLQFGTGANDYELDLYTVTSTNLTLWYIDPLGHTVKIVFKVYTGKL
jgi:hypothetical protein